ncbi:Alpha/beta hydrolase family-domain-containing protein [Leucosporidium creatinivorum]|uniref:Alpha/beta hydrolase family-domain-containing protein n=1 Tax=Leucosporidium creatinivorum TaxID=106004 RepID=A0A1Y2G194_9BASI|nr:Alpha/beta hydrolase family-domain-containing protein [Leucosporidium creatinivorum]
MSTAALREKILSVERTARLKTGPLVPLLPPKPRSRQLPPLPPRTSSPSPFGSHHPKWQLDTFTIPAAFPRTPRNSTKLPAAATKKPTGERDDASAAIVKVYEEQAEASWEEVDLNSQKQFDEQQQLYTVVNRYKPQSWRKGEGRGLTLVFAHANGFHKETWEPTISELLNELETSTEPRALPVDEIWSLDAYNQGDSGLVNDAVLGNTHTWADAGRDILNFLISYLPSPSSSTSSSAELPYIPSSSSLLALDTSPPSPGAPSPSSRLHRDRLIVGIGHSAGGTAMAFASTGVPSLFSSVILCDPVLPKEDEETSWAMLARGAIARREKWGTREEAKKAFLSKAFFRQWDERVLDAYLETGLKDVEGGVALKTKPVNEALPFSDPMAVDSRRACARLSQLPSELPVHFIHSEIGKSILSEEHIAHIAEQAPYATVSRLAGGGHLMVQEDPLGTAKEIAKCLRRDYPA